MIGFSRARTLRRMARLALPVFICALPASLRAANIDGGASLLLARPMGSELSEVYSLAYGLALDVRFFDGPAFGLSIQTAPAFAGGTPESGSLASDAHGKLFLWPSHLIGEYIFSQGKLRPYAGAGVGLVYVHESLSFSGPLGDEEASSSTTRLSFDLMAGVERNSRTRPFAELHYHYAGASGVEEQSGSGISLSTLQLRVGVRTVLK